jgi:bacillithiol biosynthesis deacetylase BshB1
MDGPLDVVAVGAHPDDVEIACGGTLARLVRQGYRVGIVDLTDGEPTPLSAGPEVRLAEAARAAETLGVHQRITLDLVNRRLFDSFEARVALAKVFRRWRPRIVLGFGDKTPLASPDHWQASQITDAAVFYSRLTKWESYFDGQPPHTIDRQLYFRLAFEPRYELPIENQIVVDIGDELAIKLAAVQCYESQFPDAKSDVLRWVESMAICMGRAAGVQAAEAFISVRPNATSDLVKLLLG